MSQLVGTSDSHWKLTDAVHAYNPTIDSWNVISHINTAQYIIFYVVFPESGSGWVYINIDLIYSGIPKTWLLLQKGCGLVCIYYWLD